MGWKNLFKFGWGRFVVGVLLLILFFCLSQKYFVIGLHQPVLEQVFTFLSFLALVYLIIIVIIVGIVGFFNKKGVKK